MSLRGHALERSEMPEAISSLLITWPGGVVAPSGSFPGNDIMIHSQTIFLYNRTKEFTRMPRTPQDFVSKWKRVRAREKQTYQEHCLDLCHLVGHQTSCKRTHRTARPLVERRPLPSRSIPVGSNLLVPPETGMTRHLLLRYKGTYTDVSI